MPQHDRHTYANASATSSAEAAATNGDSSGKGARDRSLVEQQINENLRRLYQQKLQEEVPQHLQILLERLKEQDRLK